MQLFVAENWDCMFKIANRNNSDYCGRTNHTKDDTIGTAIKKTIDCMSNHYSVISLEHHNTIEMRLWGGIKSSDELLFYMDMQQALIRFCDKKSLEKVAEASVLDLIPYLKDKDIHIKEIYDRVKRSTKENCGKLARSIHDKYENYLKEV